MNQNSNTKKISYIILLLCIVIVVKFFWVTVSWLYLPARGISLEKGEVKASLYYRYKLASNSIAPPKIVKSVKQVSSRIVSMKDIRLVGLYSGVDHCIVTLVKGGKSYILSKGEDLDQFVLTGASAKEAYFQKNKQKYTLMLFEEKKKSGTSSIKPASKKSPKSTISGSSKEKDSISKHDGITVVPRTTLKNYVSDLDKAMRDIGLRPLKQGDQMIGYKVRFIRKSSPFSQLGLERGDVIKAINGEDIIDLAGPMNILKSVDTLESLTITVIRNNEEKDLEYEVK